MLHSGNLVPVLEYYQKLLGIDYVVGNAPRMDGNMIIGIEIEDFASRNFKVDGCQKIIDEIGAEKKDVLAIGDSPADRAVFSLADKRIVINPKGGTEQEADIILNSSLAELISILQMNN